MEMLKERIKDNDSAARLIEQAQERLGDDALKNALAAFYLQPASSDKGGSVEFAHKSFSEFLFAQLLKESLEEWTVPGRRGEEFLVKNGQMAWEIYDLLGYGGLTQEIVEYLMGLLTTPPTPLGKGGAREGEFRPVQLFNRLENFYLRWCDGEFIDALQDNYPQKKMSQLQGQGIKTGVRQVDVYAGLNVMILLFELHRYAQSKDNLKEKIVFYPCGNNDSGGFDKNRLSRIMNYSNCINHISFLTIARSFLSGANFGGLNLGISHLPYINFSKANFEATNLTAALLDSVNFSGANLSSADLDHAWLKKANLTGANLKGANLSEADLENISWDEYTNWDDIQGLETAVNVPEALKQQLGLG
jgi:hypothetical protein